MPKRSKKPAKPISEKQRAKDDELRALLHNVDMRKFGQLLKKAVAPAKS
jgi:hypothetical protein